MTLRTLKSRNQREGYYYDMEYPNKGHKVRSKNRYATQKAYSEFCKKQRQRNNNG